VDSFNGFTIGKSLGYKWKSACQQGEPDDGLKRGQNEIGWKLTYPLPNGPCIGKDNELFNLIHNCVSKNLMDSRNLRDHGAK
jgi:hypothetical protein